jgi:hypothetical protein
VFISCRLEAITVNEVPLLKAIAVYQVPLLEAIAVYRVPLLQVITVYWAPLLEAIPDYCLLGPDYLGNRPVEETRGGSWMILP